jgi:hypothetical protein
MSYTPEEIRKMVLERENDCLRLHERFEDDYGMFRMNPFKLSGGDYENVTGNDPMTLCNKITESIGYAPYTLKIPEPDDKQDRLASSNAERFINGCINMANSRLQMLPTEPHIQGALAWYAAVRGWTAIRVLVRKEEDDGPTIPDIRVLDPRWCTWDVSDYSLLWFNHKRVIGKEEARKKYGADLPGRWAWLYDFYDDTENVILIDGIGDWEFRQEHYAGHVPAKISACGCVPLITSLQNLDTLVDVGESVLAPNRNLFPIVNKLLTLYLTIVSQGAHNPLAIYSMGGRRQFKKSPYYPGSVVQLDISKGESVKELYKPEMPKDTQNMLGMIMQRIAVGGLSPINFGELNQPLPYSGINLLTHSSQSVIEPRKFGVERDIEWIGRELLTQFADGGFQALEVHGRTGTNEYFHCELSPEDIQGDWYPECEITPSLPEDELQKYTMAQIAVVNNLLSRRTARERILNVRDTDREEDRVLEEMTNANESVRLLRMRKALMRMGEPELAAMLPLLNTLRGGGGNQGGETTRPRSYEGIVNPAFAHGLRPETMPGQRLGERRPNPPLPPEVAENYRRTQMMGG